MGRLSFFFKRLVRMDFKAMWKTTALLKERSGKGRLWLLFDMLRCAVKYNAGYVDYKIAQMYRLNDAQKRTQITRGISNSIVRRMNDKAVLAVADALGAMKFKSDGNIDAVMSVNPDALTFTDTARPARVALSQLARATASAVAIWPSPRTIMGR